MTALELDDITCRFAARGGLHVAVEHASVTVGEGEFVSLVGPTGCGKSTLLNAAAGLRRPDGGAVRVFGRPLAGRNAHAGYLFQGEALLPWRSARDNVAFGLTLRATDPARTRAAADDWLKRVGLAGHGDKYPHELSGGMRKRVALAQTLAVNPRILLMDEPFSALDVQTRVLMENELLALWQQDRKSVLFVTHDLEEAIALSDRVVVLGAGPASRPVGEFVIDLPRPRDVAEVRLTPRFVELHRQLWGCLRDEVMKAHATGMLADVR